MDGTKTLLVRQRAEADADRSCWSRQKCRDHQQQV
jgi:hypothetical protein